MNELVSILKSYNLRLAVKTLPFPLVTLKTIFQDTNLSFLENTIDEISVPQVFHCQRHSI